MPKISMHAGITMVYIYAKYFSENSNNELVIRTIKPEVLFI